MIEFEIGWYDSMGAKSSSVLIRCGGDAILIDPGVAIMHPGFPAPWERKLLWLEEGRRSISGLSREAGAIVISHYHYDHFTDFDPSLYGEKTILAKDPNRYINNSQRRRALGFFEHLYGSLEGIMEEPEGGEFPDPMESLPLASTLDMGDYNDRRMELLEKGISWFRRISAKWGEWERIPELGKVRFADGRTFRIGRMRVRFSPPLFHGIEFSRLGWVVSTVVECGPEKIIHTSDLNGPVIEDYASWIAEEDPDVLFLDGPPTYLLGFTMNMKNFRRTLENGKRILAESNKLSLVIYDHHLAREPRFRERTRGVWERAEREGIKMLTAAEYLGKRPVVLEL